jgi:glycerol-3-phosphate cytidylyltransferase-like family protein
MGTRRQAYADILLETGNRCRYMYRVMQTRRKVHSLHMMHEVRCVIFEVGHDVVEVGSSLIAGARNQNVPHVVA